MSLAHHLATCLLFPTATASLPSGCCHHLFRHPCCTPGSYSNLLLEQMKKGKDETVKDQDEHLSSLVRGKN